MATAEIKDEVIANLEEQQCEAIPRAQEAQTEIVEALPQAGAAEAQAAAAAAESKTGEKLPCRNPAGAGWRRAWQLHSHTYACSAILTALVLGLAVLVLILACTGPGPGPLERFETQWWLVMFGGALAILYTALVAHGRRSQKAVMGDRVEGLERVAAFMDQPRYEDPVYNWKIECYHYDSETYTETQTDSEGNITAVTKTQEVRVVTHSARVSGVIPTSDYTPVFVPQPEAQQTLIKTHLCLDFESSNYLEAHKQWCMLHRSDAHQDVSRTEELPSRASSCLAVWVPGTTPWWISRWLCCVSNVLLCGLCFRWKVDSTVGEQEYTYHKVCHKISLNGLGL